MLTHSDWPDVAPRALLAMDSFDFFSSVIAQVQENRLGARP